MENEEKFKVGQCVVSPINAHKIGTILNVSGDVVEVRWDGDTKSVIISNTRVRPKLVIPLENSLWASTFDTDFKKGDYLEVQTQKYGVVRGAALTSWGSGTSGAHYEMLTDDGLLLFLNSNVDRQTVLFRADIARGLTPEF